MFKYTIAVYADQRVVTKFEETSISPTVGKWMKSNRVTQQMLDYSGDDFYIRITKRTVKEEQNDG